MGGGPVRNTNLLVWGVDLVEEHLMTCAGIPSRPPVAARPLMYIAEYSINAQKSGKIQHIDFLKVQLLAAIALPGTAAGNDTVYQPSSRKSQMRLVAGFPYCLYLHESKPFTLLCQPSVVTYHTLAV